MQREAARAQAAQVRAQAAARREAERARAAYLRAVAAEEKERKRLYAESRMADVAAMNDDLETAVKALEGLLAAALKAGDLVSFSSLKRPASPPPWRRSCPRRPRACRNVRQGQIRASRRGRTCKI
jgi:restriction system protein